MKSSIQPLVVSLFACNSVVLKVISVLLMNGWGSLAADLPWEKWSWAVPQEPIEHFFRRKENLPFKNPTFDCKCPPYKECTVDFKINEAAAEFLNMRGVLKERELKDFKEEVKDLQATTVVLPVPYAKGNQAVMRRLMNSDPPANECCCPPRSIMMPAFITNQKFDDVVESFDKKLSVAT